jgi:hypothetical protein
LPLRQLLPIITRLEPLPPTLTPNRRRVRRFVLIAVAALLLLSLLVVVLIPSEPQLTWLTPAELAHATKTSELTIVKRKLINLTAPLWRWYHSNRRSIQIRSNFLTLSTTASEQMGLGPPTTNNADGLRAWILSPAELKAFLLRFHTLGGASEDTMPAVLTADGNQASQTVIGLNLPDLFSRPVFQMNVLPRAASHSVKLFVGATHTLEPDPASTNAIEIKTNFAATCAAVVPNNGGLVLDGGNPGGTNTQTYWLIVSPMMIDASGNPIKP